MRVLQGRHDGRDEGFTLIEVIMAMVITLIVMGALMGTIVGALKTVVQARERQTATALATEVLEQLRALPYDTVTTGSGSAPADTYVSGGYLQTSLLETGAPNEAVVVNAQSPKSSVRTVGNVSYTVRTYVTHPPSGPGFNLTAVVEWTSNVFPGGKTVSQRTTTYSPPNGCLTTSNHPFAAPCQAYLQANAGSAGAGYVTVGPVVGATLEGFSGSGLDIALPSFRSAVTVEQTVTGGANVATTSAGISTTPTRAGGAVAEASVDSDPSSVAYQDSGVLTTSGHSSATQSLAGPAGALAVRPSTSDSGTVRSAVMSKNCVSPTGSTLITGPTNAERACSTSAISSGSGAALTYTTPAGGVAAIVEVGAPSSPSRAVGAHLASANSGFCSNASTGVGCAVAAAQRATGAVVVGSPTGATGVPGSFTGLVKVDASTETAKAEEGIGATAPTWTRTGRAYVWNGTGYTTLNLNGPGTPPAPGGWPIAPVTLTYGAYQVHYEGEVMVRVPTAARSSRSATTPCVNESCTSTVDGSSSVRVSLRVTISTGGAPVGSFATEVDLGGLTASAGYRTVTDAP